MVSRILSFLERHRLFATLLLAGAALRLAAAVAYRPALMWDDSWEYLHATTLPGDFSPTKPNGYPVFLDLVRLVTDSLQAVTTLQHVAGLATGTLVYALLLRQGMGRGWAAGLAGVVLLDAYAIALEQHVLAEAWFALAMVVWAYLALGPRRGTAAAAAAGLVLAGAVTLRSVAVFALPVWAVYCFWHYRGARPRAAALLAAVVPLLAYGAYHERTAGGFGFNQWDGMLLYARVAELADCGRFSPPSGTAALCPTGTIGDPDGSGDPAAYYQFSPYSPARRTFGDLYGAPAEERLHANSRLRDFALAAIEDRPLRFTGLVAAETLRFFRPGEMSRVAAYDEPILFPEDPRPVEAVAEGAREAYAPGYVPRAGAPARTLAAYGRLLHTPRWLVGLLVLATLAALVACASARWRPVLRHRRASFLLVGSALALLVGSALTHFEPRYLVPVVPLVLVGGGLAVWDLASAALRARPPAAP